MPHDLRNPLPAKPRCLPLVLSLAALLPAACTSIASPPTPGPLTTAHQASAHAAPAPQPAGTVPDSAPAPTGTARPADPVRATAESAPQDLLQGSMAYAEQVRLLSSPELTAEIARIGEPGGNVRLQMHLALALLHTTQPADVARALGLLQRVIQHPGAEADSVKPLARLLSARLQAQRRLEESQERLSQQLRESQRRNDLLSDQLDAMRAIERSLSPRPASPVVR